MKTLKKILLAAGVAFIGCFPVKKSFSQESNYIKFDFREDFGKEVINFDKNLSFSQMYVKGDIETRDVFTSFEAMLNEFFLDDYFKSAWGVKLIGDEKISLNPQIAVFLEAEKELGIKTIHVLNDGNSVPSGFSFEKGPIAMDMIRKEVPDYRERMFYISGPKAMVDSFKLALKELGVKTSNIKTDFFPGFT